MSPDSRVSRPTTIFARPVRRRAQRRATARPSRTIVSQSMGSTLASPRIPSVPNSARLPVAAEGSLTDTAGASLLQDQLNGGRVRRHQIHPGGQLDGWLHNVPSRFLAFGIDVDRLAVQLEVAHETLRPAHREPQA